MIELALNGILNIALIKTENFVGQIQPVSYHAESFIEPVAPLHVVLRVSVKILIAVGALQSNHRVVRSAIIHPKIRVDAGVVVADGEAHREARLIVGKAQIPVVRSLSWKGWLIGAVAVEGW